MGINLIRACVLLLITVGSVCVATETNINAMLGTKWLEQDDWAPNELQGLLAVQVDVQPDGWPIALALNMVGSSDYDRRTVANVGTVETYGGVTELQLGVGGKLAVPGYTTLYAGGGGTFASGLQAVWTPSRERAEWGYGVGTWAHAGVYWTMGSFNLGVGGGWSWVPMEINERDIDAGGWRVGILLGGRIR